MQTGKMQGNQQDQHNRRRANRVLQQCVLRPDVGGFYLCEHAVYLSYPVCSQHVLILRGACKEQN
jgi:hypothetical protein